MARKRSIKYIEELIQKMEEKIKKKQQDLSEERKKLSELKQERDAIKGQKIMDKLAEHGFTDLQELEDALEQLDDLPPKIDTDDSY